MTRRKHQFHTEERRRLYDVVVYEKPGFNIFDDSSWHVYDDVTKETVDCDNEHDAIDHAKSLRRKFRISRLAS